MNFDYSKAFALTVLLLLLLGCSSQRWIKSMNQIELHLTTTRESASPGEKLAVIMELTNKGDHDVDLCLGEPVFHMMGDGEIKGGPITIVDHKFCDEKLTIRSCATRSWEEHMSIWLEKPGKAKIYLTLEVVNPNNCDSLYGCEYSLLHSQANVLITARDGS